MSPFVKEVRIVTPMKKKILFGAGILWQVIGSVLLVALIGIGILAWRLSEGPVDLEPVLPYIEERLNAQNEDMDVDIDTLVLEWQGDDNLIGLKAGKVIISNSRGPFLYTPEVDINIALRSLLLGRIEMDDIWIRRISLSLTRYEDGSIQVTGQAPSPDNAPDSEYGVPAIVTLNNLLYDLPILDTVRIDKARITYRDMVERTTRIFDPVSAYVDFNTALSGARTMSGFFTLPFEGERTGNAVTLDFSSSSDPLSLNVKGRIKDTNLQNLLQFTAGLPEGWTVDMAATADVSVTVDNLWNVTDFAFNAQAQTGTLSFPLSDDTIETVRLDNLVTLVIHDADSGAMKIEKLDVMLDQTANVSLTGILSNPGSRNMAGGNLKLAVDKLPQVWFERFWKEGGEKLLARDWLVRRIQNGTFSDIAANVIFDMRKKKRDDALPLPAWLQTVKVDFAYEGMDIDYNEPMIPAVNVTGTGRYEDIALSLNVESARIGDLAVNDATLYFNDLLTKGAGTAKMHFPIEGPVAGVFDYIAREPINALDKVDMDISQAEGQADLVVDISFPTVRGLPIEAVTVDAKGILSDVSLPNAIRNLTLSGGPFNVAATAEDFKITGKGRLHGQPIDLEWHEYFSAPSPGEYLSFAKASLTADEAIRRAFIGDAADYFTGLVGVDLTYRQQPGGTASAIDLALDMRNAALDIPELGITKAAGDASTATLDVALRDGNLRSIENLTVKGGGISINNGRLGFGTENGEPALQSARLENIRVGENDLNIVVGTNDGVLKVNISGAFLDARPILHHEKQEGAEEADLSSQPYEIGLDVDEMRTADNATVRNVRAYARGNAQSQIERFELDAVAGNGALYVRYTPMANNALSLQVEADDAGATLRAFDLYPNIIGGQLRIGGRPLPGGRFGDVRGKARIDNFVVENAPVIARLVNALSLPGIMGLLEQRQLGFSRLEADFEWRVGRDGDTYLIENGTTSGASLGLTFDGTVDTARDAMNIRGTAAPLSGINRLIGNIPIIGDILTGGEGGAVVAATYVLQGPIDDPQVIVNPLSILTPGILRRMLFENAPVDSGIPPIQPQPNPRTAG